MGLLLLKIVTRATLRGFENFPRQGPALITVNHLGDLDAIACLAFFPRRVDYLSKAELYDFQSWAGSRGSMVRFGFHRGQPARRALRAALNGLAEGRYVTIAPEGRESASGCLEPGTGGAAFLALRAKVPVLPVTFTGTENEHIYGNLKRLRRSSISITVGPPYWLEPGSDYKRAIQQSTEQIMLHLAAQLPAEYQGVYQAQRDDPIPVDDL